MKDKYFITIIIVLGCFINAQSYSKAEQKVIDAVNDYWEISAGSDKKAWKDVFHDSYKGWNKSSEALSNKTMVSKWIDYNWGKDEVLYWNINPIGVQLYDNFAIVHYYYMIVDKNKETEKSTTSTGRWTDVLINVKGKWKLLSDHGGKKESKTQE